MDVQDADLQAIYQATDSPLTAAAEEAVPAAADEAAAPEQDAATEPTETETPAEPTEEEALEDAEAPAEDAAAEVEAGSDDTFQDLLDDIPSNETLLATHKRIPQETKDALTSLADRARAERAALEPIGGQEGAKILTPIAALLQKAEVTEDDTAEAWGSLIYSGNNKAAFRLLQDGAKELLFNRGTDPVSKEVASYGDAILENRFGDGYSSERIEKLVNLEKAGYINADEDYQTLQAEGKDSTLYQTQQAALDAQAEEIKSLKALVANPQLIEQRTVKQSNAVKDMETVLGTRIAEGITPFRERGRWAEDSPLTKIVTKAILSELKDDPDYKEAVAFVSQEGFKNDAIPFPVQQKLHSLVNKARGRFGEDMIAVNKALKSMTETSQNAKINEEVKKEPVKPKPAEISKSSNWMGGATILDPDLAAIYNESDSSKRAAA